ncbi:hypothetical protein HDV57DRAFT_80222 [Trichoderma longibrachiatum]|uniref:Uncharacterized protein n=1 Tax=Trichoderma longibrachiatum ATCC 18648 TaxID=983965 RepID=A0A2T4BV54_TRILO|nr:hypothetical protein M440DRAFT_143548 [Trichoderma longibrachiatum ATCC 18648]
MTFLFRLEEIQGGERAGKGRRQRGSDWGLLSLFSFRAGRRLTSNLGGSKCRDPLLSLPGLFSSLCLAQVSLFLFLPAEEAPSRGSDNNFFFVGSRNRPRLTSSCLQARSTTAGQMSRLPGRGGGHQQEQDQGAARFVLMGGTEGGLGGLLCPPILSPNSRPMQRPAASPGHT